MYDNYHTDRRVMAANHKSMFKSVDHNRMRATVELTYWDDEDTEINETVEVPIKFEVCPTCDGRGSHVNPSIDCNGLSREDFAEDPDFAESYFRGDYDVTCYGCGGRTTVPVINEDCCNDELKETLEKIREQEREQAEYERISAWERRMGC